MEIRIDVGRKIVANGKEYDSVDELPPGFREAIRQLDGNGSLSVDSEGIVVRDGRILYEGVEYSGRDELPVRGRMLYDRVAGMVRDGADRGGAGAPFPSPRRDGTRAGSTTEGTSTHGIRISVPVSYLVAAAAAIGLLVLIRVLS